MGGRGANVKISGRVTKLPDLEESEKQIAWAKDIRESYLELMREKPENFMKELEIWV
ncbi:hypothetical protein [Bulleidia extructa]|uniref:hypothetical protein n=1 Tax=Bulleidia extructa TaxID=118748 RepID=UPI003BF438EF